MIHIATATDERYLPWAATAILSALDRHASGELFFHVLHDGALSTDDASTLEEMIRNGGGRSEVRRVEPPRAAATDRFGATALLRFALPETLPEVGRVLYLDADTFVVDRLDELLATDLGGCSIGAVANVLEPAERSRVDALGIHDHRRFFNSGVLVMDLEQMRRDATSEQLSAVVRDDPRLLWPDQDALNVVFAGRWHALHPRWNAMNSLWTWRRWAIETFGAEAVAEAKAHPGMLHFEGPHVRKPWHYLSEHPFRDAYRTTLRRTPWAAAPLLDETRGTRMIARLPRRWRIPAYLRLLRARARSSS